MRVDDVILRFFRDDVAASNFWSQPCTSRVRRPRRFIANGRTALPS